MLKKIISSLAIACGAGLYGQVTINVNIDALLNASGGYSATSSLVLIVADVDGNGFGLDGILPSDFVTAGNYLGSSNDYIAYAGDLSAFSDAGVGQLAASDLQLTASWGVNDKLAIVWFPTLTTSSTLAGSLTSYGYIAPSIFVTPSSGGTSNYQIISANAKGYFVGDEYTYSATTEEATASFVTEAVPEPSTWAVMLMGTALIGYSVSRRKRA